MLPIAIILMLLLRMDGLLTALQYNNQGQNYIQNADFWKNPFLRKTFNVENQENSLDNQLIPANSDEHCTASKHRWHEWADSDDRHILKDAKTSFLPHDAHTIPHGCPDKIKQNNINNFYNTQEAAAFDIFQKQRPRRDDSVVSYKKEAILEENQAKESGIKDDGNEEAQAFQGNKKELITDTDDSEEIHGRDEYESHIAKNIASLESYWNEQGTRESIRKSQAKTMLHYMDKTTNPCTDFYKYACGRWEKHNPIPRDKAGFDTFEILRESLDYVLKQLLESPMTIFEKKRETEVDETEKVNPTEKVKEAKKAGLTAKASETEKFDGTEKADETDEAASTDEAEQEDTLSKLRDDDELVKAELKTVLEKLLHEIEKNAEGLPKSQRNVNNVDLTDAVENEKEEDKEKESDGSTDDSRKKLHLNSNQDEKDKDSERMEDILDRYKRLSTNTQRKRLSGRAAKPQNYSRSATSTASLSNNDHSNIDFIALENAQIKAKNLYKSCINSKLLSKRGVEPLKKLITDLGGWPVLNPKWDASHFDWLNLTAHLRRYNNDIFIVQWVGPDIKNSDENIIQFDQTSLGLPTREYFLQQSNAKYLNAYKRFMADVMHKLGASKSRAQRTSTELIKFETLLAGITAPAEMRMNVTHLYKRMTLKNLSNLVPQINWKRYLTILQDRHVRDTEEVVIFATNYMRSLVNLVDITEPRTLANYLIWRFVRHRINNVDDRFDDVKQNFYHALFGREESPSRWKVCVAQVNTNMGMAVGSMFVTRYFDENSKRDTMRMTHEIQRAFRDILRQTDWIDNRTKALAEDKVNAMSLKIGYPDFILESSELNEKYHGLVIHPDRYFENTLNMLLHTSRTEQNRLMEKVNKTHWQTAPAIVNAYYSRNKNQIMFPAGILQPPFYHRHFPRALNFGGIGVVIGHELTHGFDDKGRLFDSNGNIHKWWTDFSIRGFDDRARCIISQYSNYTVPEVGITLNGESTQGENIADNGGLRQAFHAYSEWLRQNPHEVSDERLPGLNLTGPQLFFLNFGQVWCGSMRPEAIRNKLNTAIHSPGRFRVIGTLSNSYDFAREFNCPPGSPMNPDKKCTVW